MRLPRLVFVCLVTLACAAWAEEKAPAPGATPDAPAKPESLKDRASYAFGVNLVGVAKQSGIELEEAYFVRGVRDALADKLLMTPDEIRATLQEQERAREAQQKGTASAGGGESGKAPAAAANPDALAKPESLKDRASYAFGVNLVAVSRRNQIELDEDYFVRGVRDALANKVLMTPDEIGATTQEQEQALAAQRKANASAIGIKNKMEGDAFLAENTKREGVVTLPSGLQYKVLKEGAGPIPKETDRVKVNYRGKLLGGPEFDSSYDRGEPTVIPVNAVIPGWREALRIMPVGSQWKLWIPPQLAYGDQGKGGIGPHATIVFEVELLGIEGGGGSS